MRRPWGLGGPPEANCPPASVPVPFEQKIEAKPAALLGESRTQQKSLRTDCHMIETPSVECLFVRLFSQDKRSELMDVVGEVAIH